LLRQALRPALPPERHWSRQQKLHRIWRQVQDAPLQEHFLPLQTQPGVQAAQHQAAVRLRGKLSLVRRPWSRLRESQQLSGRPLPQAWLP
jgi:hypothetical protein